MNDVILAADLPTALDGRADVAILSLDCFDTLLWRDTHAPSDVFRTLDGITPQQRGWAEQRARSSSMLRGNGNEVGIADIYAQLFPNATPAKRHAMVAAELAAEARHCFGFQPTIALMQQARARGLRIIIVSDTYLDTEQLGDLIAKAAGQEVRAMIDRIFCSSVHGLSKSEGLIGKVVAELGVGCETMLHIGDNRAADLVAAQKAGVQALHLKQFTETTEQRLRLEAATSAIIHAGMAADFNSQPHRAPIAIAEPGIDSAAERLGYTTIGPLLYGFAQWIAREADKLRVARSGQVHIAFLMRDGYLPRQVFDTMPQASPTHAIEISRFTATAASFATEADVLRYLEGEVGTPARFILAQLLFEPKEVAAIIGTLPARCTYAHLVRAIRSGTRMQQVLTRSQQFSGRLVSYLRTMIAPAEGDTLMLVDLGYNGSVQNQVTPILERALNVAVAGRYLLLREQDVPGFDKAGFIAAPNYDANTLEALCGNVAVLEQLCTASQGSVVDYTRAGRPVRAVNAIKGRQSDVRDAVQQGAIDYARANGGGVIRSLPRIDPVAQRMSAAAIVARLMFLPMAEELAVLERFQHDVNLGAGETVPLFDVAIAQRGLRQRGLFYMRGAERMYLPAELHGEGLAVKLTLMAHKRFGLALKYADFIDRTIALPVLIADGRQVDTAVITATPTHDGYYIAPIPIGDCRFSVGLQFGRLYEWLQVESAVFMPVDRFLSDRQRAGLEEIAASPTLEGIERTSDRLFHCEDDAAFMMIPPPPRQSDRAMMLAVVFRPIVARATVEQPAPALAGAIGTFAR